MLFVSVLSRLQPAGPEESQTLLNFLRNPPIASTVADVESTMRRYRLAQRRLMQFGLPDIAPGEQLRGISNMIKNIEKKYPAFSMRINLLKLFPETSSRPTSDGIEKYLTTIEAQITELSADESCRSFKQDFGNASVVSTAAADKDTRKCYFHAKPGGCKRDNCPFKHEGPSGGDAGKGKGKGGKDGKDAGKGAKGGKEGKGGKGGKGKDSHAKAANATPNPNPKANPKASPKADPKANPKASAKQLLGVDKNQQSEAAPSAKASSVRIFRAQVDPVAAFPCEHKDFMRSCIDDAHVIKDRLTSGGDDQSVVVAKATTHLPKGSVGPPDRVLLDSGANELCRPLTADIDVEDTTKYMPLGVTLASGQTTQGYRTRKDGEILMPMGSTEWICGLAKLAQAGFRFTWDWEGPSLETRCGRSIPIYLDNGLPFVSWENFREIRSAISKDHRARVNKAVVAGSEEKPREEETSNPVILEEGEHMQIEGNGHEDRDQTAIAKEGFQGHEALQSTEDLATKLLEKDRLTPDDVLKLLQAAPLKRRLRRRRCEGQQDERVAVWNFGFWRHGGVSGLCRLSIDMPQTTRVLNKFVQQLDPNHMYATITITENTVFKPHRDKFNDPDTQNLCYGLSRYSGGEIWVCDEAMGPEDKGLTWRVPHDGQPAKPGRLLSTCRKIAKFSPRALHGTEAFDGTRVMILAYTPRDLDSAAQEVKDTLLDWNFRCKLESTAATAATALQQPQQSQHSNPEVSSSLSSQGFKGVGHGARGRDVVVKPIVVEPGLDKFPLPVECSGLDKDGDTDEALREILEWDSEEDKGVGDRLEPASLMDAAVPETAPAPPVSSTSATDLSPKDDCKTPFMKESELSLLKQMMKKCRRGLYDPDCSDCHRSRGLRRPFRRLRPDEVARGTLAIDVSGPHVQAANDARYALITTLTLESGESLPFVEHLRNRKHQNIFRATLRVLARITSMTGGKPSVFRIHSDNALEFWAERFVESLESLGLWVTKTVPHCPQSNGRTERMIQQMKLEAAIAMLHGRLSPKLWPYALSEAAFMRRAKVLNIPIPSGAPRPGDHVLIKREKPEAFGDRTIPAIYLSQDDSTPGGAWVMHQDADKPVITRARLPLLDDKPRARWKRTITPGGESVWTSTVGEVVFADLPPDDRDGDANILTLEERLEGPPDAERNLQGALLMKSLYVGTQRELSEEDQVGEFVRFAHGFLPNMMDAADDDDGSRHPADMPAEEPSEPFPTSHDRDSEEVVVIDSVQANVTQVTSEVPDGSKGDKYYVLTAKQEEQILECEAELLEASHEQATAEPVSTSVLFQENEKERSKWISGLENELRNMDEKQVYTKVKRKDIRKTLGLEDHEDLPQVLPAKLVMTRKPNSTGDSSCKDGARAAADQAKDDWLAKVRMVVCGNYEDGTNLAIESLRALFSRAAREATWLAGALDISCAFLNAWLQERHKVLVKPPAAAVKTGHFHEDELLWLHRALYGLRRSPKEWQHERDTVLQDAVLRARAGDMFGDVTVKGLGEPGVFGLYDSEENLCGVLALYVDDCLILAPKELFTRTVSFITATWKSKVQGILARGDLKSGMEVDGVRVVDELTFLGLQLRMSDEGIHITQQRWIAQELKKRGFLHLSGCDSLPEPREGKLPSMPLGEKRDKLIKQGQMELGSLLWLTVRTRPELAAVCGVAACALTVDPGETLRLTKGVWRFIRKTWDQGLCFRWEFDSTKMENMTFSSDASLSSGASKSRSGSVIIWGNHILGWKSARQNLTAFSAQEAELEGMAQTLALGLRVSRLVERLAQRSVCKVMECDNAAALVACTKEDFYEDEVRTRHFGMRTSWIRDQAVNHHVEIRHRPGAELVSDALTKTLPRQKLHHWMSVLHGRESLPK